MKNKQLTPGRYILTRENERYGATIFEDPECDLQLMRADGFDATQRVDELATDVEFERVG